MTFKYRLSRRLALVYTGLLGLILAQQSCADPQGPEAASRTDAPTASSVPLWLSAAPAPGSTLTSLALSPATTSLHVTAGLQFTPSATWSDGSTSVPAVTWTATGGVISSTGRYTAGAKAGTFRVIATQPGGSLADTSVVTITSLVKLDLTPAATNLQPGATAQFQAMGTRSDGSIEAQPVTYSATGGTITSGGLYTAGSAAGSFRVIAVNKGGTLADTAAVTIAAAPPVLQAVILTPASASVVSGGTRQFSVSGQWSDGGTSAPSVTYTATGGTISGSGLYTAGGTAGSFRVIAIQQAGTRADTAAVTVTAAAPVLQAVILTPASTSVVTGATKQCSVSGQWSDGSTTAPSVTYAATGGTITTSGLYTAGSTTGTFRVVATQQGGTLADTTVVSVMPASTGGTGNLANMTFESGGFEGLTDGGGGAPVNGKIVTSGAYSGTHAFDVSMPASSSDQGGSGYWVGGQQYTDLWVSFAVKVITSPSSGLATQKMVIFRNTGNAPNQFGEMNQIGGQWIWNWLFTDPNKGNITLGAFGSVASGLGQWHTYKIHLQSHGTTTVTFGKDGVDNLITLTTSASPAGIPTTLTFGGTLNAGSGASHFQFDNIHIGTSDPGWP